MALLQKQLLPAGQAQTMGILPAPDTVAPVTMSGHTMAAAQAGHICTSLKHLYTLNLPLGPICSLLACIKVLCAQVMFGVGSVTWPPYEEIALQVSLTLHL